MSADVLASVAAGACARAMAARVAVMKDGRLLETGPTAEVLGAPRDAYTRTLVAAATPVA